MRPRRRFFYGAGVSGLEIFFDVDGTLVDSRLHLRPYAREVILRLRGRGHRVHMWSGYGPRWEVAERHGLSGLFEQIIGKPLYSFRERLGEFTAVAPDFVVDDHPEIVEALGGFTISPPGEPLGEDREMLRCYLSILRFERARASADPGRCAGSRYSAESAGWASSGGGSVNSGGGGRARSAG